MTRTLSIDGSVHFFQWNPETTEIIESVGTGSITVGYARSEDDFRAWFTDMLKYCKEGK